MAGPVWEQVTWARGVLGLGERATRGEMTAAFRERLLERHPDLAPHDPRAGERTRELLLAKEILDAYCDTFRFPLAESPRLEETEVDLQRWWMDKFGEDPLWG